MSKRTDFVTYGRNSNRGTVRGRRAVEHSFRQYGAGRSGLADRNGKMIAGNTSREVVEELGLPIRVVETNGQEWVIVQRTDLDLDTDTEAIALSYADNISAALGFDLDPAILAEDLSAGVDLAGLGYDGEIAALLAEVSAPEVGDGGDEFPAEPQDGPTRTQVGDLWLIGDKQQHRLLVGDCTDPANVERLMGGERADMVWTDPPYGVDYEGGRNPESNVPREKLAGDTSGVLYAACLEATAPFCKSTAPWYIWFADRAGEPVYAAVSRYDYKVRAMIIWNKLDAHYGNFMAQYMQKHEPCLYCVKDSPPWYGPTNEVTVWDVKQPTANEDHPTQKPLELAERAMRNSSARGAIVCDWFAGSGTALIAAHRLGRTARLCELSPRYADVILRRAEAERLPVALGAREE